MLVEHLDDDGNDDTMAGTEVQRLSVGCSRTLANRPPPCASAIADVARGGSGRDTGWQRFVAAHSNGRSVAAQRQLVRYEL